jgi:hypothetical protein
MTLKSSCRTAHIPAAGTSSCGCEYLNMNSEFGFSDDDNFASVVNRRKIARKIAGEFLQNSSQSGA